MFRELRRWIAAQVYPEFKKESLIQYARNNELIARERQIEEIINQRVAEVITQMDPFEPLMRKYHGIFSEQYTKPEDKLDDPSRLRLFMWAYGLENEASFKYLTDWIQNTQGNATIRKAQNSDEWFYGRAALSVMSLFIQEVSRLASHYKAMMEKRDREFDASKITDY